MSTDWITDLTMRFPGELDLRPESAPEAVCLGVRPEAVAAVAFHLAVELSHPLVCLFATDDRERTGRFLLRYAFADRDAGRLLTLELPVDPDPGVFPSISATVHAAALYEREIQDLFGLRPEGHPDPKRLVHHSHWPMGEYPLRRDVPLGHKPPRVQLENSFQRVDGDGVFEIPVGPVHAGIIEPGHFRFSVAGEPIVHLEAQLYYTHRGIEKLCEGETLERCLFFSERISGDETVANSLAYCEAVERIAGVVAPARARCSRVFFAELERLTSHLGDLAGICLDVAYGFAAFQFRMMRGWSYLVADELCGQRFLRSVNRIGGVRQDFTKGKERSVVDQLLKIREELEETSAMIHANNLFIDRVENTGVLAKETAVDLNATGPGGRASGIRYDVRKAFPYAAYAELSFRVPSHNNGDVNCRMNVKIEECLQSIDLMLQTLECMPRGPFRAEVGEVPAWRSAYGLVESPRGENVHWLMTGPGGTVFRYKVRTPSFCNWPALCHAVKGNIVPDFPLINKSFNLSYAGNDL